MRALYPAAAAGSAEWRESLGPVVDGPPPGVSIFAAKTIASTEPFPGARAVAPATRQEDAMSHARTEVTRRRFLGGALGAAATLPAVARRAGAQAKPTITYWNGLTGADGKVMDELVDQFTKETGIKVEQQRITWPEIYA